MWWWLWYQWYHIIVKNIRTLKLLIISCCSSHVLRSSMQTSVLVYKMHQVPVINIAMWTVWFFIMIINIVSTFIRLVYCYPAAAARLGLRVSIALGVWMSLCCECHVLVYCQVEVCARGGSIVQRSPTECVWVCVWVWSRNLENEEA